MESPPAPQDATQEDAYVRYPPRLPENDRTPHERLKLHRHFRSNLLPDARNLIVYLPPQYATEQRRHFPVLYLQDGQNLFDGRTSYVPGRTWQADEAADRGIAAGEVEPLIIVGIYNTGARRIAEYTPTRDWKMGGGEASLYGRLLVEELMPFIGKHYRVLPGREHTGLGGSSLGGLVSLYLGLEYAAIFGRLAIHSPSVWWNHRSILGMLRGTPGAQPGTEHPRIWLDTGDSEGARTLEDANRLYRQLLKQGWREDGSPPSGDPRSDNPPSGDPQSGDLHYEVVPGGTHDEASWAGRVGPMLSFLFPKRNFGT